MEQYDVAVIGAGVTGCSAASVLSRYRLRVIVLEKAEMICVELPAEATAGLPGDARLNFALEPVPEVKS